MLKTVLSLLPLDPGKKPCAWEPTLASSGCTSPRVCHRDLSKCSPGTQEFAVLPKCSQACFQGVHEPLPHVHPPEVRQQGPWVAKGWLFGEWKELRYGEGFIWVSSRPSRYRAKLWSWYHGPKASSPRRMARVWWRTLGRLRAPKNLGFLVFMYFVRVGGSDVLLNHVSAWFMTFK